MSVYSEMGPFRELKMSIESHDLAKTLQQSNQKSNELSTNRKCEQRVTTDEGTFTKILGADKDNVHSDQFLETPEETTTS